MMRARRWLLGAVLCGGLVALALPAPARRPSAPPAAAQQVAARAQHAILRPDQPYDAGGINEPTVLFWRGQWWLWYVGMPQGQTDERRIVTALATAPGTADPTVAASWTKRGPVVGAPAVEPSVIALPGGTLRMYSSTHASVRVLDSQDGVHWKARGIALAAGLAGISWWADCSVWQEPGTGGWHGLFEGGQQAGPWHIYSAHSRDGVSFRLDAARPLTSLAVGRGGMEGGPDLVKTRAGYALYYHAARDGAWSTIDVYRATSADGRTWRPTPAPLVTHGGGYAIADNPSVVHGYLFWGGGPAQAGIHAARLQAPTLSITR